MTRPLWRAGVHVADAVIAAGREPTADEGRHLAACPRCFSDVRRSRAFDRQLHDVAATVASVPITREVLTVPVPSIRRPPTPSLTSLGVIAALVLAAGLVAWSVLPRGLGPSAGAGNASPTLPPDPHIVNVAGATWRIGLVGTAIEVHRVADGAGGEDLLLHWDLGQFVDGGSFSALRCPAAGGGDQWLVLGRQAPHQSVGNVDPSHPPVWAVASGPLFRYQGPPAAGQAAPDGLFLYVIDPATFDPTTPLRITAPGYPQGSGMGGLKAYPTDVRQPSGCFFSG
jgi:hypothetical protein